MNVPALIVTPTEGGTSHDLAVGLDELVEAFLSSQKPTTWRAYDSDLRDFARFVFPEAAGPAPRAAVELLIGRGGGPANLLALAYRKHLESRHLASATVARRLCALSSICDLAAMVGRIDWSLRVKRPKVKPLRDVRGPGWENWRRMVGMVREECDIPGREQHQAVRDLAIIRLLWDLLLRRSEVAGLDVEHVEREGLKPASVWILGKGRDERERMELVPTTSNAIQAWLLRRGTMPGPLFCPLDHDRGLVRLTGRSIARVVKAIGKRAGVARMMSPHMLRHGGITRGAQLGVPLLELQRVARHADPRTTTRYIDELNNPQPRVSDLISRD